MCGVGRDGPFRQNKMEVHYEQHRNVGHHRSRRILRHLWYLGMLQVLGSSPSRVRDLNKRKGRCPMNKKYVCKVCGWVYDPAENNNVAFEDLPEDWVCPACGVGKADFEPAFN